jgi:predicted nuclease of predicted toxin-antitoxin system
MARRLARFLSSRGVECRRVPDVGLGKASDVEIWRLAGENDYVLIAKDEDFLYLANRPGARGRLIWIRFGNCRKKELLAAIERLWPRVEVALRARDRAIQLR